MAILGLTPNEELDMYWPSRWRPGDKWMHGGGFCAIAWLLCQSGLAELLALTPFLQRIILFGGLMLLSVGSELLQSILPYREWDWADVGCNVMGSAVGLALCGAGRRRWPSYLRLWWDDANVRNIGSAVDNRHRQRQTLVELEELNVLVHSGDDTAGSSP
jgi:hypothetical protein